MFNPISAMIEFVSIKNHNVSATITTDGNIIFEGWSFGNISYHRSDEGLFEIYIEDLDLTERFTTLCEAIATMEWIAKIRSMDDETLIDIYCDWGAMGAEMDATPLEWGVVSGEVFRRDV